MIPVPLGRAALEGMAELEVFDGRGSGHQAEAREQSESESLRRSWE